MWPIQWIYLMALILIADSSASERQRLRQIIEAQDHVVVEADSGAYCLEIAEYHHPQCVLLNLLLANPNDFGLLQTLQRLKIATIVLTDNSQADISQKCLELGASKVLKHNPESADILQALEFAINSTSGVQPQPTTPITEAAPESLQSVSPTSQ
ncbi:MAG: response regulator, partial [Leptolyngbyaceae cyanobacterium MO_188.B28]|nr:response regulator [Leptolyngbyaceae cyanobacterium MO_188.B28]